MMTEVELRLQFLLEQSRLSRSWKNQQSGITAHPDIITCCRSDEFPRPPAA
jgi:hypothetical protein